jgi:hypothetical protein
VTKIETHSTDVEDGGLTTEASSDGSSPLSSFSGSPSPSPSFSDTPSPLSSDESQPEVIYKKARHARLLKDEKTSTPTAVSTEDKTATDSTYNAVTTVTNLLKRRLS